MHSMRWNAQPGWSPVQIAMLLVATFTHSKRPVVVPIWTGLQRSMLPKFVYRSWRPALGQCEVQEKSCRTESEWRELIKPYMED
jgi:hypothetical protein